jgi:hypothetical protein
MTSTKKKQSFDWSTLALVIGFILLAILIIITIVNKEEENRRLRARLRMLTFKKHQIEILRYGLSLYFNLAYNAIKFVFLFFVLGGTYLIYESLPEKNVFEFASRFTDTVGAISLLILLICLFIEENPIDIFTMRSKLKALLERIIYDPYRSELNQLPMISSAIEETKRSLNI